MTEEFELEISLLSQPITVDGKTIQVDIYHDKGGWVLEVIDESSSFELFI